MNYEHRLEEDTRRRIRRKGPFVQQLIIMLATKRSVTAHAPSDQNAAYCRAALEEWECEIAPAMRAAEPGVDLELAAEEVIDRVRKNPADTWSKILRKGTQ